MTHNFQFAPFFFLSPVSLVVSAGAIFSSSLSRAPLVHPIPGHDILFFRCHPHAFAHEVQNRPTSLYPCGFQLRDGVSQRVGQPRPETLAVCFAENNADPCRANLFVFSGGGSLAKITKMVATPKCGSRPFFAEGFFTCLELGAEWQILLFNPR